MKNFFLGFAVITFCAWGVWGVLNLISKWFSLNTDKPNNGWYWNIVDWISVAPLITIVVGAFIGICYMVGDNIRNP